MCKIYKPRILKDVSLYNLLSCKNKLQRQTKDKTNEKY